MARGTVGERTVPVELAGGEHRLARIADVLVSPPDLTWVRRSRDGLGQFNGSAKDPDAEVAADLVRQRSASDERARRDQGRRAPASKAHQAHSGRQVADGGVRPKVRREPAAVGTAVESSPADEPAAMPVQQRSEDQSAGTATVVEPAEPAACTRCGGELRRHNGTGVCTACQAVCPGCDGPKAIQAEFCRSCARRAAGGPVRTALRLAWTLDGLPAQVQELLDTVVVLARYAHELEDELARYRSVERLARRLAQQAMAAAAGATLVGEER